MFTMGCKYKAHYKGKTIPFGDSRYSDYTQHKDPKRKRAYLKRHGKKTDKSKAGWWAEQVLWSSPSLAKNLKRVRRYGKVKRCRQ